jgi:hypothetical protein
MDLSMVRRNVTKWLCLIFARVGLSATLHGVSLQFGNGCQGNDPAGTVSLVATAMAAAAFDSYGAWPVPEPSHTAL